MKMKLFLLIITGLMLVIWHSIGTSASKDLVAAWTLDEGFGGKVKDTSGNGHNGVISGTKWVKGKFGATLEFNGDGDQVLVAHNEALNIEGKLTVEAWVFPTGWNPDLNAIA